MPNQHKTKLIGWNPEDPTLKQWLAERAAQTGTTVKAYLDQVLAKHRRQVEQDEKTTETRIAMDDFSKRALGNLTDRHREKAKAEAERIRDYAGYLIRDIEAGRPTSHYAGDILACAQEIRLRLAALEAIGETTGILDAEAGS